MAPDQPLELVFLDAEDSSSKDLVRRLALLVESLAEQGAPVLLRVSGDKAAQFWDQQLWTFKDSAFLPHSLFQGQWPDDEPVCVACQPVPPRAGALILALCDTPLDELRLYPRIFELVRRDTPETLDQSRRRWAEWKALGIAPTVRKDW
jgi:DNA polymerase-3 subunit chi